MKILSLRQFVQQAREPQVPEYTEVLVVTVRDFLDAIYDNYEGAWAAEVTCDYPEPGSFLVKFKPAAETEP
jgi:hypothetical protein